MFCFIRSGRRVRVGSGTYPTWKNWVQVGYPKIWVCTYSTINIHTHNIWIGIVGLPNHIMAQIEETKAAQRFEPRWIDERHKVVVEVQCSKSDKASKGRTMKTVDFVVTEAKLN